MRIIAGKARGIPLKAGKNEAVRPTTDRIKESLFNMLGPLEGLNIVDLFAGSGSLGLEALSRGAANVWLVESDRQTCKTINENRLKVEKSLGSESGRCHVISGDASQPQKALAKIKGTTDIIIADPPYADACRAALDLLENPRFAEWAAGAELVLEHTAEMRNPEKGLWQEVRRKHYGLTVISFWKVNNA